MIANYHTHTWRCLHAAGTEREYVENAIKGGYKILGFSDHTPMPYPGGYVSNVKMRSDQLEDYVDTVLALREEYRRDIEIHLGLEVEYYPGLFEALLTLLQPYPIEYFLLGQHYLGDEIGEPYCGAATDDPKHLLRYCAQSMEALKTGRFTYFAHPDLIHFTGDEKLYEESMGRLCQGAKELSVPLEINFLGIWDGRNYPAPRFWKIAGEVGNTVVFGADAHQPDKVVNPEALCRAEKLVKDYGLKLAETIPLKKPF